MTSRRDFLASTLLASAALGRAQAKGEYGQYLIRLAERLAPGAEPAE